MCGFRSRDLKPCSAHRSPAGSCQPERKAALAKEAATKREPVSDHPRASPPCLGTPWFRRRGRVAERGSPTRRAADEGHPNRKMHSMMRARHSRLLAALVGIGAIVALNLPMTAGAAQATGSLCGLSHVAGSGSRGAQPIVLIHGITETPSIWAPSRGPSMAAALRRDPRRRGLHLQLREITRSMPSTTTSSADHWFKTSIVSPRRHTTTSTSLLTQWAGCSSSPPKDELPGARVARSARTWD